MREVLSEIQRGVRFSCSLGGALATVTAIDRGVPVVHAAPGCAYNSYIGQFVCSGCQGGGYLDGIGVPSTRLCERHIVYGGEDRLRQQLKATLDVIDGDFIVIITGCVADLIGDDVATIAGEFSTEEVPVLYVETGGFKGNSFRGYEKVLEAFRDQLMEKPSKKEKGLINVFGMLPYQDMFWKGNLKEIGRLLERLGLEANMMLGHTASGLQSWKQAPQAELNLLLSPWVAVDFVKKFEEKFGVPYLVYPGLPIGPIETARLLRMVGESLGISKDVVEKVVSDEEREYYYYLGGVSMYTLGAGWHFKFAVIGESNLAIGVNKFLTNELGHIPLLTVITDDPPDKYRKSIIDELTNLESGLKPEVVFRANADEIWALVRESEAEVILGSSLDTPIARQLTVAYVGIAAPEVNRVITDNTLCGFKGALELASDFYSAVVAGPA
ncbi:nitrogenase component 1 [Chloroflexota bacterium]